jgi:hypothetical protein
MRINPRYNPNQPRNDFSKFVPSSLESLPNNLTTKSCLTVYKPRFTAEATFNPACCQSANTNSPAKRDETLLVRGTIKISWEQNILGTMRCAHDNSWTNFCIAKVRKWILHQNNFILRVTRHKCRPLHYSKLHQVKIR